MHLNVESAHRWSVCHREAHLCSTFDTCFPRIVAACCRDPLSHYSPFWNCYDARATASCYEFYEPGLRSGAIFFIRQITFPFGCTPPPTSAPIQSVNQHNHSCRSRPATKGQHPSPTSFFFHQPLLPQHTHSNPSVTHRRIQPPFCQSRISRFSPPKCLPSPLTRSRPPRPPLPLPRLPRRRMPARRLLPPVTRRSAPRRARRPTPPTFTRVSGFGL